MTKGERIPTHVKGFDEHIQGGFVRNSLNLVAGGPGAGKTIFCSQFIIGGIEKNNEPGMIIALDETTDAIEGDAILFGWDFKKHEDSHKCVLRAFQPFDDGNIKEKMEADIKKYKIKRVMIDSISVFAMAFKDDAYKLRKELYRLADFLKSLDCTVLVTAEVNGEAPLDVTAGGGGSLTRDGLIEFVADSVITLHNSGLGGEADRAIRVVKMRRTNHRRDPIPMKITDKGMVVVG